jgi:hypothetical protein
MTVKGTCVDFWVYTKITSSRHANSYMHVICSSVIHKRPKVEPKYPSKDEHKNLMWCIQKMEYYSSFKKEGNSDT